MNLKDLFINEFLQHKISINKVRQTLENNGFPFYDKEGTIVSFFNDLELKVTFNDLYIGIALSEIINIKDKKIRQPLINLTYTDLFMDENESCSSETEIPISLIQYSFYNEDIELINTFLIQDKLFKNAEFEFKGNKSKNKELKIIFYPDRENKIEGDIEPLLAEAINMFWKDGFVSIEESECLDLSYDFTYHYVFPEIPDPFYNKIKHFSTSTAEL